MVDKDVVELKKEVKEQEKEIRGQDRELKNHEKVLEKQTETLKKQTEVLEKQKGEIKKQREEVRELKRERVTLHRDFKKYAGVYVIETRRALATAILAAFGFLMALSWREYITELLNSVLGVGSVESSFVGAVVITLISVFGIIIVTRFLSVKE